MMMSMKSIVVFWIFALAVEATTKSTGELVRLYQHHHDQRWQNIYAEFTSGRVSLTQNVENVDGDIGYVVEINGFPFGGFKACGHFQGSPLEHQTDVDYIQEHLKDLLCKYSPPLLLFKTLDGWASDEFHGELEKAGYKNVERKPIMVLKRPTDLNTLQFNELPDHINVLQVTRMNQLEEFNKLRPAPMRHILEGLDEDGLNRPMMKFWCLVWEDKCITTAQIEVIDGIGCINMVSTDEEFRNRGLASYLMVHMIQHAYNAYPDLGMIFLESTPMAVKLYEKLGFQIVTFTNTFEFDVSFKNIYEFISKYYL